MLSALPMTAIASVLAGALGLAGSSAGAGPRLGFVLLLVFLGMSYLVARLGFVFPAIAVEERYSLRLAWQHTAGQGSRLTATLFASGFPLAVAPPPLHALPPAALLDVSLIGPLPALAHPRRAGSPPPPTD